MNNYKDQLADELYKAVTELNECLNSPKLDAVLHRYEEQHPGKTVEFIDHYEHNWHNAKCHSKNLESIIEKLGYNIIIVLSGKAQVYLFNEFGK